MSSKFDEFQNISRNLAQAEEWFALHGSPYHGGGGGIGKFINVRLSVDIYHQYGNGDRNYHDVPNDAARVAINKAVEKRMADIVRDAIEIMRQDKQKAAAAALEERRALEEAAISKMEKP